MSAWPLVQLASTRTAAAPNTSATTARFARRLAEDSGFGAATIERVKTPVGLPCRTSKESGTSAVSVAADLLVTLEQDTAETEVSHDNL
jgi:xanthine/CO dehydrogenase XdhC/CoxF family maturation factor